MRSGETGLKKTFSVSEKHMPNEMRTNTLSFENAAGDGSVSSPNNAHVDLSQQVHMPVAEQYRKLKTWLLKLTRSDFRNLIMITSAVSGEGKSVTAVNLAKQWTGGK